MNCLNESQYEQFSSTDAYTNRELKRIMGELLRNNIPDKYGKKTWYQALRSERSQDCAKVIEKASLLPEFRVLTQTSNYLAIRLIADAKMRSAQRDGGHADVNVDSEEQVRSSDNNNARNIRTTNVTSTRNNERTSNEPAQNFDVNPLTESASEPVLDRSIRDVVAGHVDEVMNENLPNNLSNEDETSTRTDTIQGLEAANRQNSSNPLQLNAFSRPQPLANQSFSNQLSSSRSRLERTSPHRSGLRRDNRRGGGSSRLGTHKVIQPIIIRR